MRLGRELSSALRNFQFRSYMLSPLATNTVAKSNNIVLRNYKFRRASGIVMTRRFKTLKVEKNLQGWHVPILPSLLFLTGFYYRLIFLVFFVPASSGRLTPLQ